MYYRSEHWFALRRLGSFWFDLNSMQPIPKLLSDTYLSLFLEQNRAQGYSIFVVRGNFPPADIEARPKELQKAVDACRAHYSVRLLPFCMLNVYDEHAYAGQLNSSTHLRALLVLHELTCLRIYHIYVCTFIYRTFTVVLFWTFHSYAIASVFPN